MAQAVSKIINEIAQSKSNIISQLYFAINKKLIHKAKTIEDSCKTETFIKTKLDNLVEIIK